MKIRITEYCQEMIEGRTLILDINKIVDIPESDALRLIDKNLAEEINIEAESTEGLASIDAENKMIGITYKKRGRPRKEVK